MTNNSLTSQRRRVQKLESVCAQKAQHVVVVFVGTPRTEAHADKLIEEGQVEARRLGKELQVIRVGWLRERTPCTEAPY